MLKRASRVLFVVAAAIALLPQLAYAQVEKAPPSSDSARITISKPRPTATPSAIPKAIQIGARQLPPNIVTLSVLHPDGSVDYARSHNSRVDAGAAAIALQIGSTGGVAFQWIAVSTSSATVAQGDTSCPSEITTGGLARALAAFGSYAAPSTLGGSASYQLTQTWTSTISTSITKICALSASSGGTLGFETLLGSAKTVNPGDLVSLSWTFNI